MLIYIYYWDGCCDEGEIKNILYENRIIKWIYIVKWEVDMK
jgi:hypothetical protein